MARLCIDNSISEVKDLKHAVIGQLLDEVEEHLPSDRIMTNLMLNGRYVGRLEWNVLREKELNDSDELFIQTTDKSIWAINGIDIALSALERVQQSLLSVIELLREDRTRAIFFFVHCLEGLERFSEVMFITRSVLKLNYENIYCGNLNLANIEKELNKILSEIFSCQEKNDYKRLAEIIEYQLITNLSLWHECLRNLKNSFFSNT